MDVIRASRAQNREITHRIENAKPKSRIYSKSSLNIANLKSVFEDISNNNNPNIFAMRIDYKMLMKPKLSLIEV